MTRSPRHPALIVVVGPTASGKTALGVELALRLGGEVINADSRQVYRRLDIGTGKPTLAERQGIPHHLFDVVEPEEDFSAAAFRRSALAAAHDIVARGRIPIVVGGTGLYVRVLRFGIFPGPARDPDNHARLLRVAESGGLGRLMRWLTKVDPAWAGRLEPGDRQRILRALDVYMQTGRPMSELVAESAVESIPFAVSVLGVRADRTELYQRIDRRVDGMLEAGLVDEVEGLLARPGFVRSNAAKAVGYRQIATHLAGRCSLKDAVTHIKRDTRRLAKRQLTWFRREPGVVWTESNAGSGRSAGVAADYIEGWLSQTDGTDAQPHSPSA